MRHFSFLIVLSTCAGCDSTPPGSEWKAGSGRAVITPTELMWMQGYAARKKPAEGTLHDLWVKTLAIEDPSGRRLLLVTADLIGISKAMSDDLCGVFRRDLGLKRGAVMIATSHTHTGPVMRTNLKVMFDLSPEENAKIDRYVPFLRGKILQAARDAVAALEPATLAWGNGKATFAVNRRNNRPASKVPEWRKAGTLKGPFDHDVPVLRVGGKDGALKAVVFGYACHCTTLSSFEWSGDYAGFAQIELEKAHPGATALFFAGCGGDQNPLPRRTVELAEKYGRDLAQSVDRALEGEMRPVAGGVDFRFSFLDLKFDRLPTRKELEDRLKDKNVYQQRRAKMLLGRLDAKGSLDAEYPYPIQVWRLGKGLTWVALGGEVVVDYSLRLKRELGAGRTWVAGYCNDVMAYIPSLRVLKEGGYEGGGAMVYYGQPTVWAPEVEERIVAKVHELAAAVNKNSGP